ncbi:MAG: hypothetical protein M3Y58_11040 [Chloroflexota bacterium]|nr:hypothetical protein [Chloroflexota bacterium]
MFPSRDFTPHSTLLAALLAHRPQRGMRSPARARLMVAAAGLALLILTLLVPAIAVGAQSAYPPNTVVSTYFDARYGEVSVVTDASGNLIDVNAATGQRIYPVYADYPSAYTNAYVSPAYTNTAIVPAYTSAFPDAYANQAASTGAAIYRQYTDNNSNCVNGQVTQTASGYYCTVTGTPALSVG